MLGKAISKIYEHLYEINRGVRENVKPSIFIKIEVIKKNKIFYDYSHFETERYGIEIPSTLPKQEILISFGFQQLKITNQVIKGKDYLDIYSQFKAFLSLCHEVSDKVSVNGFYKLREAVSGAYKKEYIRAYKKGFLASEYFINRRRAELYEEAYSEFFQVLNDLYTYSKSPKFRKELRSLDSEGKSYEEMLPKTEEASEEWKKLIDLFSIHEKLEKLIREKEKST
jgi:hypothetical protein